LAESLGGTLHAPVGPPVRVVGELLPSRIEGNHAFFDDLSAGWPRVKVNGVAGQTVTVAGRCAADYNLPPLTFTLATNGETVLEPRFIWLSGPLELWLEGTTNALTPSSVSIQQVRADFELTGAFACSNPYLNKLHETVLRTHLNYNLEHPLDPMREKDGWTQDAQGMFNTAAYLTDVSGLYRKWWRDMADNQDDGGLLGSVIPVVGRQVNHWNCPSWSGVIVFLPCEHYLYYGDRRFLENAYEPMRRYVDYLDHLASAGTGINVMDYPDVHFNSDKTAAKERMIHWLGAGDWYNPYSGGNSAVPAPLIAMPAWFNYATIVSKTAKLLGHDADAVKYAAMAQDVRERFNSKYFNPQTGLYGTQGDNQTAQLLPLAMGVVPDDKQDLTFQRLIDAIHARSDHLGVGFVGLPYLLQTLTTTDQSALANCIVNKKDYPSWNTLMHHGVLSETWSGGGAQMPSCGGAIGMWLYQSVLGIRPDISGPGFQRFLIAPQPDPATGLTWAKGSYLSVRGKISSSWKIESGKFTLEVTIPANTTATLRLPTADPQSVTENNLPLKKANGIKIIGHESHLLILEVGSGTYKFSAPAAPALEVP